MSIITLYRYKNSPVQTLTLQGDEHMREGQRASNASWRESHVY